MNRPLCSLSILAGLLTALFILFTGRDFGDHENNDAAADATVDDDMDDIYALALRLRNMTFGGLPPHYAPNSPISIRKAEVRCCSTVQDCTGVSQPAATVDVG